VIVSGYKRYYEKRKLKSNPVKKNCDIAKKIIRKYKKFWSQNYIKFRNPVTIEEISKKLDIKNHIEKLNKLNKTIKSRKNCTLVYIRNSYVRNMYKILIK